MNIVMLLASYHTGYGLSETGKTRVQAAANILKDDRESEVVITGGELAYGAGGLHHELVAAELKLNGISDNRILTRFPDTRHTVDEANGIATFLGTVEFEKLIVVTSFVHYPRAPFIFAHFIDLSKVQFVLTPDQSAKDVTLFNYLHEMEAYQEDRRRGGLVLNSGEFVATSFSYQNFTHSLRTCIDIQVAGLKEYELPETKAMNLFSHYEPNSPFNLNQEQTDA